LVVTLALIILGLAHRRFQFSAFTIVAIALLIAVLLFAALALLHDIPPQLLLGLVMGLVLGLGPVALLFGWAAYFRYRASLTRGWFVSRLLLATDRGVSLVGALEVMEKDASGLPRVIAHRCRAALLHGERLSSALARFSRHFPPLHLSMIAIGEETGRLPQALRAVRRHHETLSKARGRLILHLLYPAYVGSFLVFVMSFMNIYISPQFFEIQEEFSELGPLGAPSLQNLLPLSQMLAGITISVLSATLIALVVGYRKLPSEFLTQAGDTVKWYLPFFRQYELRTGLALFSNTVAELLRVGVPLHRACETASLIRVNRCLQRRLINSAGLLKEGDTASEAFSEERGYPPTFSWAVSVGERSGDLASSLSKVGSSLSRRLELSLNRAIEFVFPVSMIVLGAAAALFAFSVQSFLRNLMDMLESTI
jgi:MSHA biogenesis protein MshG